MTERNIDSKYTDNGHHSYQLELVGLTAADERPPILVQALSSKNAVLHSHAVERDGRFTLPPDVLERAHRIVLGAPDGKGGIKADASISYRASELALQIKDGALALAEGTWSRLRLHRVCVSGNVQVCRRRPWWFAGLIRAATTVTERASMFAPAPQASVARMPGLIEPSINDLLFWPVRCEPVCLGTVEVYRRRCCCWPILFDDLRVDDLIRDLEIYVDRLPKVRPPKRFPPPPPPPPGDPLKSPFFRGGALNELALHATNDLRALRALPRDQAAHYIQSRPYLLHRICHCDQPVKVGGGTLQPDGSFNVCWLEPWRLLQPSCHDQYAYVVKQTIGGTTTTIYDGLAAGAWFAAGEHPVLTSYNRNAFACNETGSGDGQAYVYLELIGDTESHELTTPESTGWDRVATPGPTSGLLFPNPGVGGHLRNLGGTLRLRFNFSLGMRDPSIGAHYYRVSICAADANGHPTGPRHYYRDGLAWEKVVGAEVVAESLGPVPVNGESNLYRIPYGDEPWTGENRYHAAINTQHVDLNVPATEDPPAVNHLITLEVFNAAGERLRPLGAPSSGQPGSELAKAFKFRRWFQPAASPGDDLADVHHAALTHLFCWDNRTAVADITRLVMNGNASDQECQFLEGPGSSTFAIEYRAYVPDPRFQQSHGISWTRGLNGSVANGGVGALPTSSPSNVGKPPAPPVISGNNTFEQMLTRLDPASSTTVLRRCSFAITLTTHAKTTDGEDLSYKGVQEVAAFALAIHPGPGTGGGA